jgi:hypothetical protein
MVAPSNLLRSSILFGALAFLSACAISAEEIDPEALRVLEMSRKTQASFSVISEVTVAFEGMQKQTFTGGEFHSGHYHRIEDPNYRAIADCKSQTGYRLDVATKKLVEGKEAAIGVCGIGHREGLTSLRLLDAVDYKFGKAYRVEAVDNQFRRTYDVMPNGAIVRNVWQTNATTASTVYKSEVIQYCEKDLPKLFFSEALITEKLLLDAC